MLRRFGSGSSVAHYAPEGERKINWVCRTSTDRWIKEGSASAFTTFPASNLIPARTGRRPSAAKALWALLDGASATDSPHDAEARAPVDCLRPKNIETQCPRR